MPDEGKIRGWDRLIGSPKVGEYSPIREVPPCSGVIVQAYIVQACIALRWQRDCILPICHLSSAALSAGGDRPSASERCTCTSCNEAAQRRFDAACAISTRLVCAGQGGFSRIVLKADPLCAMPMGHCAEHPSKPHSGAERAGSQPEGLARLQKGKALEPRPERSASTRLAPGALHRYDKVPRGPRVQGLSQGPVEASGRAPCRRRRGGAAQYAITLNVAALPNDKDLCQPAQGAEIPRADLAAATAPSGDVGTT